MGVNILEDEDTALYSTYVSTLCFKVSFYEGAIILITNSSKSHQTVSCLLATMSPWQSKKLKVLYSCFLVTAGSQV
jgi:hypothetical protein